MKKDYTAARLVISFGALVLILVGLGWFGLSRMDRSNAEFEQVINKRWNKVRLSREARSYSSVNNRITMEIFLLKSKEEIEPLLIQRAANTEKISVLIKKIEAMGLESAREKELLEAVNAARWPYVNSYIEALHMLLDEHKVEQARTAMVRVTLPRLIIYHNTYNAFVKFQDEQLDAAAAQIRANYASARRLVLFLIVLAVAVAAAIAVQVTRSITREIAGRERAEKKFSDLNEELEQKVASRTAELAEANYDLADETAEREQAEGNYRESNELVRLLLDSTAEAIYGVDLNGNFTLCNAACLRLLGYRDASELRGKNMHEQIHYTRPDGTPYPVQDCLILQAFRDGKGTHIDDEVVWRRDGTSLPVEYWSHPIFRDKKVIGAVVTFVDITERRRAQEELTGAKEAAEAANEAKSTFLATMSHEIRTPMNGILGMTELVLDTDLSVDQRENLGLVRVSAESLLSIIDDVLDFSKIEAGKLDLESIPFDLRESLGETMKALSFRAHQKGLELICEVEPGVPEAVLGDPGRIRQILVNLVGNAIKFTEHGEIFVKVEEESQGPAASCLKFAVKDTGIGIPVGNQKRIFDAFTQADGSMARKYGGTGLGLTICARLVHMMGGRMWVDSPPGQGSTFFFTVQMSVQNTPTARPIPLQPQQLGDLHALIVDDNFTNRRVLHGMLSRWGMKPTAVDGGRAALQALEVAKSAGHPFPLILLDGQMPEMDGFALAEHIREDPDLVGTTIMMLTSASHLGDAARCRELGISAYLVKPIRQGELLDAICHVLQKGADKKPVPLVTQHALREEKNRRRVLLAEDNHVNQTLARRLLEKRGYTVSVAGDGRAALQAFEKESFDLVLMDVQMPEMDGFEATAAIRAKEKETGGRVPIIAMTAHALKGDRERCLAAGMDGYVSKPIRTDELFSAIEEMLRKGMQRNRTSKNPAEPGAAGEAPVPAGQKI
ncbi:MAG TPA: response regulator [Candidatus Acidoferrum sp.]|nr:response regulator [Candidatus Acidoferrum sp.]